MQLTKEHFDKTLKQYLSTVATKKDLSAVKDDLTGVKKDLSTVKDGLSGVKKELFSVKDELSAVKTDVVILKEAFNDQAETLKDIKHTLNIHTAALDKLLKDMDNRETEKLVALHRMERLEKAVKEVADKVGVKIDF